MLSRCPSERAYMTWILCFVFLFFAQNFSIGCYHSTGWVLFRCKLTVAFPQDICSLIARMNSQCKSSLAPSFGPIFSACGSLFDMVTKKVPFLHLRDCQQIVSIMVTSQHVLFANNISAWCHSIANMSPSTTSNFGAPLRGHPNIYSQSSASTVSMY